jgi:hypothetical protein
MNKAALKKAIQESEFISDPGTFEALILESAHLAKAINPLATGSDTIATAHLILKFEDALLEEEEEVSNTDVKQG